MPEPDALIVMECPTCGRLWVGKHPGPTRFTENFTQRELDDMRGPHWPPRPLSGEGMARQLCYGTPESTKRDDVEAAYILGGKEPAEALWEARALGKWIEAYERRIRGT